MDPLENTELLTEICRAIVKYPDKVSVKEFVTVRKDPVLKTTGPALDLRIVCHPGDAGRIIGKDGEMIQAIRQIFFTIAFYDQTSILIDLDDSIKAQREKIKVLIPKNKNIRIVNE